MKKIPKFGVIAVTALTVTSIATGMVNPTIASAKVAKKHVTKAKKPVKITKKDTNKILYSKSANLLVHLSTKNRAMAIFSGSGKTRLFNGAGNPQLSQTKVKSLNGKTAVLSQREYQNKNDAGKMVLVGKAQTAKLIKKSSTSFTLQFRQDIFDSGKDAQPAFTIGYLPILDPSDEHVTSLKTYNFKSISAKTAKKLITKYDKYYSVKDTKGGKAELAKLVNSNYTGLINPKQL